MRQCLNAYHFVLLMRCGTMFMSDCVKIWLSRVRGNGMFKPFAVAGESTEGISVGLALGYAAGDERVDVGRGEHTPA